MTPDEGDRGWRLGRSTAVAVILVSVALNVVLLGRMLRARDRVAQESGAPAQGEDRIAQGSRPSLGDRPGGANRELPPPRENRTVAPTREVGPGAGETGGGGYGTAGGRSGPLWPGPESARTGPGGTGVASTASPAETDAAPAARSTDSTLPGARNARASGPMTSSYAVQPSPAREPGAASSTATTKAAVESDPTSDRIPPALQSLWFDPAEVSDGSTTTLMVQASDDLSGVKLIWGVIRSPSGAASLQFGPQEQGESGQAAFKVFIPKDAEVGDWYVSVLSLTDKTGNSVALGFVPGTVSPQSTLRVVSSESDSTPPEVLRIFMEKPTVDGGERNVVSIEARDDRSGVAAITGYFQSAAKSAQLWFNCTLNSETSFWDGVVSVPTNADCGEWTLAYLRVVDKAGNIAYLQANSPLVAAATFQVSGGTNCDSTPPTIDAFYLTPAVVSNQAASEILVTATVSDIGSGAVSLSGWYEGPVSSSGQAPRNYFTCSPDRSNPDAPWTGRIQVPQFAPKGIWKVGVISVQDNARNFRRYTSADPVVAGAVFEVQ
jgi:hypothetical protein